MNTFLTFLAGVVVGAIVLGVVAWFLMPGMMLTERQSPVGLDATVKRITAAAEKRGWVVQSVVPLDESVKKHGGPDVRPVRLVNLCEANHAGKILLDDGARRVSVFMPCTISVYEKSDGTVWIGTMNPGLMGRMFGGVVSEVMAGPVAKAQSGFVDAALAPATD